MSPAPERLFFALWPGEGVRAQLAAWSRALQERCGGRATHAQDLHLTLAFLGSVVEPRAEVERAADAVARRAAVLVLDRPGYWKHNRIVWAGASRVPIELDTLVRELREALTRAGVAFDAKPFVSHVTLLRDAHAPATIPDLAPVEWQLDGFALVKSSRRTSAGRYEVLRAWT